MNELCPRCRRRNPAEARFCHFDGVALTSRGDAERFHAGTAPFPTPFPFAGEPRVANFNQLAMVCQKNWNDAKAGLAKGDLAGRMEQIGRLDLAKAARLAQAMPDADRGLDQFLSRLPAETLQPPKLAVEPRLINLGQLKPGTNHQLDLSIVNVGMKLLTGQLRVDCDWLALGDGAGAPSLVFQTPVETHVRLRVVGKRLRGEAKPRRGTISVESNGGDDEIVVQVESPIVPFPEGVLAGATTPREVAVRAKKDPKMAAGLFESGAVEAWYRANAWEYPVQGPAGSGLGAIQQFFEALGLVKAPAVTISHREVRMSGRPGESLDFELTVKAVEQKPVFAHAVSDRAWLVPGSPIFAGNRVTLPIRVPVVPDANGQTLTASLTVRANGNQKGVVPVVLEVVGRAGLENAIRPASAARLPPPDVRPAATFDIADPPLKASSPARTPTTLEPKTDDASSFGMNRLVYWSGLLGGWSALIGWLAAEIAIGRWIDVSALLAIVMAIGVSAAIGGGLSLFAGLMTGQWHDQGRKILIGCLGGAAAGLVGSVLGSGLYAALGSTWGRVVGWTFMGLAIGGWEGAYSRDRVKLRNGLIGGGVGGFLAGLIFLALASRIGGSMGSRAVGFVVLGFSIGLFVGLVRVLLKDGWLTVIEGFRPGRQFILTQGVATLGTSEKASLIFIAYGAKGVEPIHAAVDRTPQGHFAIRDEGSRTGTLVNGAVIAAPTGLRDGDVIQIGPNKIRFNERVRSEEAKRPA